MCFPEPLLNIKSTFNLNVVNIWQKILQNPCYYSCAVRHMSYKMGSVSSFWCHICACKFIYLGWEWGRGLFEIFSSSCKNSFVVLRKWVERFKKAI